MQHNSMSPVSSRAPDVGHTATLRHSSAYARRGAGPLLAWWAGANYMPAPLDLPTGHPNTLLPIHTVYLGPGIESVQAKSGAGSLKADGVPSGSAGWNRGPLALESACPTETPIS